MKEDGSTMFTNITTGRSRFVAIVGAALVLLLAGLSTLAPSANASTSSATPVKVLTSTTASADSTIDHDSHPLCVSFANCPRSIQKPQCFMLSKGDNDPDDWQCPRALVVKVAQATSCWTKGAVFDGTAYVYNSNTATTVPDVRLGIENGKFLSSPEVGNMAGGANTAIRYRATSTNTGPVKIWAYSPALAGTTAETATVAAVIVPFKNCTPKVHVSKKVVGGKRTVRNGKIVKFTITVRNTGRVSLPRTLVTDPVPSGFVVLRKDRSKLRGGKFVFRTRVLKPGKSQTFTVRLKASTGQTAKVCNVANVFVPGLAVLHPRACLRIFVPIRRPPPIVAA